MTFFHHVQYEELLVVCIMFEVLEDTHLCIYMFSVEALGPATAFRLGRI